MRRHLFPTWQLYAMSGILSAVGVAGLLFIDPTPPTDQPAASPSTSASPTPTVTVTAEPTKTRTAHPTRTHTPRPTVTVTVTPSHSPSPSSSPSDSPSPSESVSPFLLHLSADLDPGWGVAHAAAQWNADTGCDLFTFTPAVGQEVIDVSQVPDLKFGDNYVRGLYSPVWPGPSIIELNPNPGIAEVIASHELGHALGLDHSHDPHGVMNPDAQLTVSEPDSAEVAAVRILQAARCAA